MTTFEERLLAELRQVVAMTPAPVPQASRLRRRLVLSGATATAAAAATLGLVAGGGEAAYAVDTTADGTVRVKIEALTDPEGLERELRAAGVPADVVLSIPCGAQGLGPEKVTKPFEGDIARAPVPSEGGSFTVVPSDIPRGERLTVAASQGDLDTLTVAVGKAPPPAC